MADEVPKLRTHGFLLKRDLAYGFLPLAQCHCLALTLCDRDLNQQPDVIVHRNGRWPKNEQPPIINRLLLPLKDESQVEYMLKWLKQNFFGRHIIVQGCLVQPHNIYLQVDAPQFIFGFDYYQSEQEKLAALPVQHERVPSLLIESIVLAPIDPEYLKTNKQIYLISSAQEFEVSPETAVLRPTPNIPLLPLIKKAVMRHRDSRSHIAIPVLDLKQRFTLTSPTKLARHPGFEPIPPRPDEISKPAQTALIQACHPCDLAKHPNLTQGSCNEINTLADQLRTKRMQSRAITFNTKQAQKAAKIIYARRLLQAQGEITKCNNIGVDPPAQALKMIAICKKNFAARKQAQMQAENMDFNACLDHESSDPSSNERTKD